MRVRCRPFSRGSLHALIIFWNQLGDRCIMSFGTVSLVLHCLKSMRIFITVSTRCKAVKKVEAVLRYLSPDIAVRRRPAGTKSQLPTTSRILFYTNAVSYQTQPSRGFDDCSIHRGVRSIREALDFISRGGFNTLNFFGTSLGTLIPGHCVARIALPRADANIVFIHFLA